MAQEDGSMGSMGSSEPIEPDLEFADAIAEQKGEEISLETPPNDLLLQWSDHKPAPRGSGKKSDASGSKAAHNPPPKDDIPLLAPPPTPVQPAYYPPPPAHPYGHYPPYPPPYPPNPHYGYPAYGYPPPPPPLPHGYGNPGFPSRATGHTLLSEWLVMCDQGDRGENSDNFAGLIAGFSAQKLFRLSDLQHKPIDFFTQIDFPTTAGGPTFRMPLGTASCLCQYLARDLA
ncbi:hypothetical protein FRC09_017659 [Ceratobasidium sp. 395]|nr:hypothetical protein FRC09_017659 [Ceratobasidium sp. 395]